jgi:hypothetical protein
LFKKTLALVRSWWIFRLFFLASKNFDAFIEKNKKTYPYHKTNSIEKAQKNLEIDISLSKLNNDIYTQEEKSLTPDDRVYLVALQ